VDDVLSLREGQEGISGNKNEPFFDEINEYLAEFLLRLHFFVFLPLAFPLEFFLLDLLFVHLLEDAEQAFHGGFDCLDCVGEGE